jgi:predicted permease
VDSGLVTEEVLTVELSQISRRESRDSAASAAARSRYQQMQLEIAALPGVRDVAYGSPPLQSTDVWFDVKAEGRPLEPGQAPPRAELRAGGAGYFSAAGIPLLKGRVFTSAEAGGGTRLVIINQVLGDRLFPGQDPVGQRVALFDVVRFAWGDWLTIVGVVGSTRDAGLDAPPRPAMFLPQQQGLSGALAIRAERDVAALVPTVMRIVRRIAPNAAIERVATISETRGESVSPRRVNATLITSFGLLALLIAAVGIAGVLAFSVSARTNEIGIRMSLGADAGKVQRMILGEGGVLLALGLGLGIAGAFAFAGTIRGLLYGIPPHDPVTFIGVAVTMAAIGIGSCWIPALRAARIDPAIAMRSE